MILTLPIPAAGRTDEEPLAILKQNREWKRKLSWTASFSLREKIRLGNCASFPRGDNRPLLCSDLLTRDFDRFYARVHTRALALALNERHSLRTRNRESKKKRRTMRARIFPRARDQETDAPTKL